MKYQIKIIKAKNNNFNYDIQILRTIFSFNIVVVHCLNENYKNGIINILFLKGLDYYVPTFFIISFFFLIINLLQILSIYSKKDY